MSPLEELRFAEREAARAAQAAADEVLDAAEDVLAAAQAAREHGWRVPPALEQALETLETLSERLSRAEDRATVARADYARALLDRADLVLPERNSSSESTTPDGAWRELARLDEVCS